MGLLHTLALGVFAYVVLLPLLPLVVIVMAMTSTRPDRPPRSARYPSGPPPGTEQRDPTRSRHAPDGRH